MGSLKDAVLYWHMQIWCETYASGWELNHTNDNSLLNLTHISIYIAVVLVKGIYDAKKDKVKQT